MQRLTVKSIEQLAASMGFHYLKKESKGYSLFTDKNITMPVSMPPFSTLNEVKEWLDTRGKIYFTPELETLEQPNMELIADIPALTQDQQREILDLLARAKATELARHIDELTEYLYLLWQDWYKQADAAYEQNATNQAEIDRRVEAIELLRDRAHAFTDWQHDGYPINWETLGIDSTDYQGTYTAPVPPAVEELKPLILTEYYEDVRHPRKDGISVIVQEWIEQKEESLEKPFYWFYESENLDGITETIPFEANLEQATLRLKSGIGNNVFSRYHKSSEIVKALIDRFSDSEIDIYQYKNFCNIIALTDPSDGDSTTLDALIAPEPDETIALTGDYCPGLNIEETTEDKVQAALKLEGHVVPTRGNTTNGDKVTDHAMGKTYLVQGWVTEMISRKTLLQVLYGRKSECIEVTDTLTRLPRPDIKAPEWMPVKGDRVVIKSEKRHGTVGTCSKYTFGLTTSYSFTVYTDNGAEFYSVKLDDLEPETTPPDSVLLDPVVKGRPQQPITVWNEIISTRKDIVYDYEKAKKARIPAIKQKWTDDAKAGEKRLKHLLEVFLDWETQLGNDEAALELTGELELERLIRHAETRGQDTTALQRELDRTREDWQLGDEVSFRKHGEWFAGYRIKSIDHVQDKADLEECESKTSVYGVRFGNLKRDRTYDAKPEEKKLERVTLDNVATAKLIRPELAEAFPGVKFSVTCDRQDIDIKWLDGPAVSAVKAILKRYQPSYESYDGDGGCYHSSKEERDGKLVEYWNHGVNTRRSYSKETVENAVQHLGEKYANFDKLEIKFSQYGDEWSAHADKGNAPDWDTVNWFHREYHKYLEEWSNYEPPAAKPQNTEVMAQGSGFCTVSRNEDKDGIEVRFKEKPGQAIIDKLKSYRFRWSKFSKCWYATQSDRTIAIAQEIAAELNNEELTSDCCQSAEPATREGLTTDCCQSGEKPFYTEWTDPADITPDNSEHYNETPNISSTDSGEALQINPVDNEPSPIDKPEISHEPPDLKRFNYPDLTLEVWESTRSGAYFVTDETGKNIKRDGDSLVYAASHEDAATTTYQSWMRDQELEQLKAELDRVNLENERLKTEIERLTPPPTPPDNNPTKQKRSNNVVDLLGKREERTQAEPISQAEQALIEIVQAQSECFGSDVQALLEENRALMRDILAEQKPKQTRKPKTEKKSAAIVSAQPKPRGRRKKDRVCEGQIPLFDLNPFLQLDLFAV